MKLFLLTAATLLLTYSLAKFLPILPDSRDDVRNSILFFGMILLLILSFRWIEAAKRQKPLPRAKRVARGFEVVQ
jgi:hypothetical protein